MCNYHQASQLINFFQFSSAKEILPGNKWADRSSEKCCENVEANTNDHFPLEFCELESWAAVIVSLYSLYDPHSDIYHFTAFCKIQDSLSFKITLHHFTDLEYFWILIRDVSHFKLTHIMHLHVLSSTLASVLIQWCSVLSARLQLILQMKMRVMVQGSVTMLKFQGLWQLQAHQIGAKMMTAKL